MAGKKKQAITKKRIIKDVFSAEGLFNLENLKGFFIDTDDGLRDVSGDFKELNGKIGKITVTISDEEDLTEKGFSSSEDEK